MRKVERLIEADRHLLAALAHILGPSSAAAKALAELERRKAAGESVTILHTGRTLVVGPPDA